MLIVITHIMLNKISDSDSDSVHVSWCHNCAILPNT